MSPYVSDKTLRRAGFTDGHVAVLEAGTRIPVLSITDSPHGELRLDYRRDPHTVSFVVAVDRIKPFPLLAESEIPAVWSHQRIPANFLEPIAGFAVVGRLTKHFDFPIASTPNVRVYCEMAEGDALTAARLNGLQAGDPYRYYLQFAQGMVFTDDFRIPQ